MGWNHGPNKMDKMVCNWDWAFGFRILGCKIMGLNANLCRGETNLVKNFEKLYRELSIGYSGVEIY